MTKQTFEVGQKIRRVAPNSVLLEQGKEYEVERVDNTTDTVSVLGHSCFFYDMEEFRPSINIKPIHTEETTMAQDKPNTDEQELTEALLRTKIGLLEDQVDDLTKQLDNVTKWWLEEKAKAESLSVLVIKQATKLME